MYTLEPAVHACPCLVYLIPSITPGIAISRSASESIILGFFPPSSKVTGQSFGAAFSAIILPTAKEPVKVTFLTF